MATRNPRLPVAGSVISRAPSGSRFILIISSRETIVSPTYGGCALAGKCQKMVEVGLDILSLVI